MGCRDGGLREEENGSMVASLTVSDALLFTTMWIVELPVDVHAKDGSIYSGIFYTALVDNGYAIVLKNARMIKKGSRTANIGPESIIETLIVQSEDLVQVVAKGVPVPSDEVSGHAKGDGLEAIVGINGCSPEREANANEHNRDIKLISETRFSGDSDNDLAFYVENHSDRCIGEENMRSERADIGKRANGHILSTERRQIGDFSGGRHSNHKENPESQDEITTCKIGVSSITLDACQSQSTAAESLLGEVDVQNTLKEVSFGSQVTSVVKMDNQKQKWLTSEETTSLDALPSSVSVAAIPTVVVSSESKSISSSPSTQHDPPNSSKLHRTAKEFKLNPGAKVFSPSLLHHRSVIPAVETEASVTYVPDVYAMVPIATAENEVVGQVISRTQPIGYVPQYHNIQAGTAYLYSNSQNVIAGGVGALVSVHPILDAIQSAAGFSQEATGPLLTQHHMILSKHQDSV